MKKYEKIYEDVIKTSDTRHKQFKSTKFYLPEGLKIKDYAKYIDSFAHEYSKTFFTLYAKFFWIQWAFGAKKGGRIDTGNNLVNNTNRKYIQRNIVGHELNIFMDGDFYWLNEYMKSMFPKLIYKKPEVIPVECVYPFKNITLEFMQVVYQMEDKMELLKYADERDMKFCDFCNYVVNHALCINDEIGRVKYTVKWKKQRALRFYIKNRNY